jgi:hypothetical protein
MRQPSVGVKELTVVLDTEAKTVLEIRQEKWVTHFKP